MSKTQNYSKCETCGRTFLFEEIGFHKCTRIQNQNFNTEQCFHLAQNIYKTNISSNNQNNSHNYSVNFIIPDLSLYNINPSSEEQLNSEGITNVINLNSNFNNDNMNGINNHNIFNLHSENSVYITNGNRLSSTIVNKLRVIDINQANINKYNDQICTICQDIYKIGEKCMILNCKHDYHEECIKKWFERNNKCPICKHPIIANEIL